MSLEVEVTRDSCILMEDTEMWWDWQDKCWSCRTEVPASCFLFKTKKLGFYFHLNQLKQKEKGEGGRNAFDDQRGRWSSLLKTFLFLHRACRGKPIAASVKGYAMTQMGSCTPTSPKPLDRKLCILLLHCCYLRGGGEGNLKGFLWCLKQQTSQQRDKLCPCVQSCLCVSGEISTLPTDFVGSLINCCYCQFTAYPSCCLDPD